MLAWHAILGFALCWNPDGGTVRILGDQINQPQRRIKAITVHLEICIEYLHYNPFDFAPNLSVPFLLPFPPEIA
jgi:hypothetical protein